MDDRTIYLDNAATSWPKPKAMLEKMVTVYHEIGVSPGRGSYDQAVSAEGFLRKVRQQLAIFFNAPDPDRVIFTSNATDALNLAILGMVNLGDHVITTRLEHNSVLRPLYHLQQTQRVSTTLVSFDEEGFVDPEEIRQAIISTKIAKPEDSTESTSSSDLSSEKSEKSQKPTEKMTPALVIVNHASNVLGTVQPVAQIGEVCNAHGVPLLVDTSQSAGVVPVDMVRMNASAIVFTGHKSLYGPTGIGGLILHPDLDIRSTRFGGTGMESKSLVHTQTFPQRLEAGTHNLMGIIGLSLALEDLTEKGMAKIHQREMGLTRRLYQGLKEIPGVKLYGGPKSELIDSQYNFQRNAHLNTQQDLHAECHVGLFSVNVDGMHPEDLAAVLDGDFNIAVRVGLHCAPLVHESMGTGDQGAVRFSLGRFTTEEDVDRTIEAMKRITAIRKG